MLGFPNLSDDDALEHVKEARKQGVEDAAGLLERLPVVGALVLADYVRGKATITDVLDALQ